MKKIIMVMAFILISFSFYGCLGDDTQSRGEKIQEGIMTKAIDAIPTPQTTNFLTRKNVVKWMERMDTPNKTFYIYVTTQMGQPIGYFVAQYRPVSTATYLTPTKRESRGSYGVVALPAPALDGTYYGEGGAADQYFWFDAETDAFIELAGFPYILSDQPLSLDVPRIYSEKE